VLGLDLRLVEEATPSLGIRAVLVIEDLQRVEAFEDGVPRSIHLRHTAAATLGLDDVLSNLFTDFHVLCPILLSFG
jgi:hypothetical protein